LAPVCIFEIFSTHKHEYFGYTAGIQLQNETEKRILCRRTGDKLRLRFAECVSMCMCVSICGCVYMCMCVITTLFFGCVWKQCSLLLNTVHCKNQKG